MVSYKRNAHIARLNYSTLGWQMLGCIEHMLRYARYKHEGKDEDELFLHLVAKDVEAATRAAYCSQYEDVHERTESIVAKIEQEISAYKERNKC